MDKGSEHPPEGTDDWFVARLVSVQGRLYRFIATLVFNRADVEDLCQKTCLTAWQERRRPRDVPA